MGRPTGNFVGARGRGGLGAAVEQIFGSHLTVALLIQRRERCTGYRFHPRRPLGRDRISVVPGTDSHAARWAAVASLFDRCSLTIRICLPTTIEKFRRAAAP